MKFVNNQKPKLVYVDDEEISLKAFKSFHSDSWDIRTYVHPAESLKELKEFDPLVIIADMKMGKIGGVEYLQQSIQIIPGAIRIIYSGYAEQKMMLAAIKYAQVKDYIIKPFSNKDWATRLAYLLEEAREEERENERTNFVRSQEIGNYIKQLNTLKSENRVLRAKIELFQDLRNENDSLKITVKKLEQELEDFRDTQVSEIKAA